MYNYDAEQWIYLNPPNVEGMTQTQFEANLPDWDIQDPGLNNRVVYVYENEAVAWYCADTGQGWMPLKR